VCVRVCYSRPSDTRIRLNRRRCCLGADSWGPGNDGGTHWRHLANTTEWPVGDGDAAVCLNTVDTCYHYIITNIHCWGKKSTLLFVGSICGPPAAISCSYRDTGVQYSVARRLELVTCEIRHVPLTAFAGTWKLSFLVLLAYTAHWRLYDYALYQSTVDTDIDIIQMTHGSECDIKIWWTSGASYFNVARTTVFHLFCRMTNH